MLSQPSTLRFPVFLFEKPFAQPRWAAAGGAKVGTASGGHCLARAGGLGAALKAACALRPAKTLQIGFPLGRGQGEQA
jgi:hypothetical protein